MYRKQVPVMAYYLDEQMDPILEVGDKYVRPMIVTLNTSLQYFFFKVDLYIPTIVSE